MDSFLTEHFPYGDTFVSPTWTKQALIGQFSVKYSDGSYPYCMLMAPGTIQEDPITTATTPDERSLKFKFPFPARIVGVCVRNGRGGNDTANVDYVLYNLSNTILASLNYDATYYQNQFTKYLRLFFPTPPVVNANTWLRLSIKPATTTNNWFWHINNVPSVAAMDCMPDGRDMHMSTRTDGGAWTDSTTSRPFIALMIDRLHDGQVSDIIRIPAA
ncbi:hypothetical protein [Zavarzinella formosa]|uniref:hypothetical protein n=1 Tax=Zavarzinella formosa TaxID=360055 RepID=UPI0012FB94C0|nr:hypothetical protein [Zavarzinella formosa]